VLWRWDTRNFVVDDWVDLRPTLRLDLVMGCCDLSFALIVKVRYGTQRGTSDSNMLEIDIISRAASTTAAITIQTLALPRHAMGLLTTLT
jgi:hypothetical protein